MVLLHSNDSSISHNSSPSAAILKTRLLKDNSFSLVGLYFIAGTCPQNSAHDTTSNDSCKLSLQQAPQNQTSLNSWSMSREQISVLATQETCSTKNFRGVRDILPGKMFEGKKNVLREHYKGKQQFLVYLSISSFNSINKS